MFYHPFSLYTRMFRVGKAIWLKLFSRLKLKMIPYFKSCRISSIYKGPSLTHFFQILDIAKTFFSSQNHYLFCQQSQSYCPSRYPLFWHQLVKQICTDLLTENANLNSHLRRYYIRQTIFHWLHRVRVNKILQMQPFHYQTHIQTPARWSTDSLSAY